MKSLHKMTVAAGLAVVVAGAASAITAVFAPRIVNGVPSANYTGILSDSTIILQEANVSNPTIPNIWNAVQDRWYLSADGVTPLGINPGEYFTLSAKYKIERLGTAGGRIEGGFRFFDVNDWPPGDAFFMVSSDNPGPAGTGEQAVFGDPFQFSGWGQSYINGTEVEMTLEYTNQGGVDGFIQSIVGPNGTFTSGFKAIAGPIPTGLEPGTYLGGWLQMSNAPDDPMNGGRITWKDIRLNGEPLTGSACVPEPGTFALLGAGLLPLLGIRRRK